jgi:hypothetical protein
METKFCASEKDKIQILVYVLIFAILFQKLKTIKQLSCGGKRTINQLITIDRNVLK